MICPFCNQVQADNTDVHTELTLNTNSFFTTGFNQNIALYSSSDSGISRTRNSNRYVKYNNGSYVLYLSHNNASNYADVLAANYNNANCKAVDFITSMILGTVVGTVVSLTCGAKITLPSIVFANGLSTFISTMGCLIASLSTAQRSAWILNLSKSIDSLLRKTNTNVGIWISFNSKTRAYQVGIQTY